MAITYRFPICLWCNEAGWWTASLLEWDAPAGTGKTSSAAMKQLQEYLQWTYEQDPWQSGPDFHEVSLTQYKVRIRPEYHFEGRRFPCDDTILLRVHCAVGRQEHGLFVCSIPILRLRFYYYEEKALRTLVPHYVQQQLEGVTPQGLSRYLPPRELQTDHVVVTVRGRKQQFQTYEPELPMLSSVAEPLGDPRARKKMARPWERDREVQDLISRCRREKANVILLGESASGKTTVLAEAVRQMERQDDEDRKVRHRFWLTSGARLIAGMKYLGQWEERCEAIIHELSSIGGTLCVESLLDLVREGGEGPTDSVASFFLPYLQRGELQLIAEATPSEMEACRRLLPGLAEVFQVLKLEPFNRAQAITVLQNLSTTLRQNLHLEMEPGVIDLIYHLYRRFLPYQAFPGRAVGFLQRLFEQARQKHRGMAREEREAIEAEVTKELVIESFVRQTGLPELFLRDDVGLTREEILEYFQSQILGQEEACQVAANLVLTFKAGMNDPRRPVGAFLFCGPTGVGKTALARAMARYFFEHGEETDRLIRLDMSEHSGPGAGERLVSQPDGRPSEMVRRIREQPFVVLLLDEIEKADPVVFDVLLNVLDEGRLTDRYGRLTTFRSAIIIMTSNLGAGKQEPFGFGTESPLQYEGEALAFFRPEFFNRLDGVVTFHPLGEKTIEGITRKELGEIKEREGIARLGLSLEWSDSLVEHLAKVGFDPLYGARPLQRALETFVVTPLARYLLEHPEVSGTTLLGDLNPEGKVFYAIRE